jgi:1-phosphofructokinase family hexose kinase
VIIAAGLTPAWQQILQFDQLHVGEVNRARKAVWCGSGKVLNVGIALSHLEAAALTIAPLGGAPREAIEREFERLHIPRQWIAAIESTRVCTTLLDESSGATTELVENARPLGTHELDEFCRLFVECAASADVVVLTGSLPPRAPGRIYSHLLAQCKAAAVLDIRGPELLAALEQRPMVVKPNREELAATLGRTLTDDQELVAAMRELNQRGAQWVVVTAGKAAVWISSSDGLWRIEPPSVQPVVNPIGCGDCVAAGIAAGLAEKQSVPDAICLGLAAAAENVSQLLPARIDRKRVDERAQALKKMWPQRLD